MSSNLLKFHKIIIFLSVFINFRHLIVTSNINILSDIECSISQLWGGIRCIEINIIWDIRICYPRHNIYWITLPFLFPFLITSIVSSMLTVLYLIRILFIIISCFQIQLIDLMRLVLNTWRSIKVILFNSLSIDVWIYQIVWRCDIWSMFLNV